MKNTIIVACASLVLLPAFPAAADDAGLSKGLWEIRIFTPVPKPELKNEEQTYRICYDEASVSKHTNPVLPPAQAKSCQLDFTDMGDVVYDASCKDGDHRLRVSEVADGYWRGTYRFVGKDRTMLEPAVELKRIEESCDRQQ